MSIEFNQNFLTEWNYSIFYWKFYRLYKILLITEGPRCIKFAGHAAYHFSDDPFYAGDFITTVKQLVERAQTGD